MKTYTVAIFFVFICGSLVFSDEIEPLSPADEESAESELVLDGQFSDQMRAVVRAFSAIDRIEGTETALHEAHKARELVSRNDVELMRQILAFTADARKAQELEATIPYLLPTVLEISPASVLAAVGPYLMSTDKAVRDVARDLLGSVHADDLDCHRAIYVDVIRQGVQKTGSVPKAIVLYMFERSSEMALLAVREATNADQDRQILWAEHFVSDTVWKLEHGFDEAFRASKDESLAQLHQLAKHDAWWVRYYVVVTLTKHSDFQSQQMVVLLKSDSDSAVRNLASKLPSKLPSTD